MAAHKIYQASISDRSFYQGLIGPLRNPAPRNRSKRHTFRQLSSKLNLYCLKKNELRS